MSQEAGSPAANTIDLPKIFFPAFIAGLAYYLGLKTPEAAPLMPQIKAVYDEQWNLAADASRERASFFVKPGGYERL